MRHQLEKSMFNDFCIALSFKLVPIVKALCAFGAVSFFLGLFA